MSSTTTSAAATGDASPNVLVYVTGYGPFGPIKENPSGVLAQAVAKRLAHDPRVIAVHHEELEVSLVAAGAYFDKLATKLEADLAAHPGARALLCHLGVNSKEEAGTMRVEVRAYNELFASIPDVRGVALNHDPIDPEEPDGIEHFREGRFGTAGAFLESVEDAVHERNRVIAALAASEKRALGHPHDPKWIVSRDAGRYLCNYTLYRALGLEAAQAAAQRQVSAVFIHVVDPTKGEPVKNPSTGTQEWEVHHMVDRLLQMVAN